MLERFFLYLRGYDSNKLQSTHHFDDVIKCEVSIASNLKKYEALASLDGDCGQNPLGCNLHWPICMT